MKLRVDTKKCSGIGLCEMTAPSLYEIGDDGQSHLVNDTPNPAEIPIANEAVANCPTGALSVEP